MACEINIKKDRKEIERKMTEETCPYEDECRVRQKYPEFCYLNMNEQDRNSVGNSCVFKEEYDGISEEIHDLICPTGLMRKLMRGDFVKGRKL